MRMKRTVAMTLCALMACALCLAALPKTAHAAANYTMDFSVTGLVDWHNGVPIDYSSQDNQDAGWTWAHGTKTLTLSGLQFETENQVAIKLPANATIVLTSGTRNTLTANPPAGYANNVDSIAIYCTGALTITGSGTLTATAGARQDRNLNSYGVHANGRLTINGGTLIAKGNVSTNGESYGVGPNSVTVSGGRLVAQGYTKASQAALSFDPAAVAARGSTDYDGANLTDYNFSANPPQRYATAYAQAAVPKTGDDTPLAFLCIGILLAGTGLAALQLGKRRMLKQR